MSARVTEWKGRPAVVYYDLSRKRKVRKFKTREEAEAFAVEIRKQIGSGEISDDQQTVADYVASFMAQVRTRQAATLVSKAHVANCHFVLENILVPREGGKKLAQFGRPAVKRFLRRLLNEQYAITTVNTALALLRLMLSEAIEDGLLSSNPCTGMAKRFGLSNRTDKVKAMTKEQAAKLLKYVFDHEKKYYLAFTLYLRTGMRLGEGLALRREDFDYEKRILRVRGAATSFGDVTKPKTDFSKRDVEVPSDVCDLIREELNSKVSPYILMRSFSDPPTSGQIRTARNKLSHAMRRARRATKLDGFSIHSLRHTFATTYLSDGGDLLWVSRQLGHASIQITADLYGRGSTPSNREGVERMAESMRAAEKDAKYAVRRVGQ